jgi:hypothetical protein
VEEDGAAAVQQVELFCLTNLLLRGHHYYRFAISPVGDRTGK